MENCSICLEPTHYQLECLHHNCIDCLKRLIKKSDLCPVCRRQFNTELYKYKPPRHTPNLKLSMKTKKFFNKFLSSRHFLVPNKHQKFYASLQSAYHDFIYANNKYVNPKIVSKLHKYEALQLYIFFKNKNCIFHHHVKQEMIYAIEMYLCYPDVVNYINTFYSLLN